MVAVFFLGIAVGVGIVLLIEYFIFLNPFAQSDVEPGFNAQFSPFRIPIELKQVLLSSNASDRLKKPESCISLNFLVHFLYQEFRHTKAFRKWVVSRLQMEFNDLISRTNAGKLLQDIRVRDFSVGNQFPVIKDIHVGNVTLGEDNESFEELDLILNLEYRGGLKVSVDVTAVLGRRAFLSVKVSRIAGEARLRLSRRPYTHWSFAFTQDPTLDFAVDSHFHGRPLPQLVPVIIQQFKRAVRRKHVLPHYKVRYRPFFANPLLQPSANARDFKHVKLRGAVQIYLKSASRINLAAVGYGHTELYCQINLGRRPYIQGSSLHYVSVVIKLVRHNPAERVGLAFHKVIIPEKGPGSFVEIVSVVSGSLSDRSGFKVGDLVSAVNNLPIISDKQALKLLNNTSGELVVLIERKLDNIENEDDIVEHLASTVSGNKNKSLKMIQREDGFMDIEYESGGLHPESDDSKGLRKANSESNLTDLVTAEFRLGTNDGDLCNDETPAPLKKARSSIALHTPTREVKKDPDWEVLTSSSEKEEKTEETGKTFLQRCDSPVVMVSPPDMEFKRPPSPTPSQLSALSRRQKIAAKATEKAAKVAEKWTFGKGMVKEMWQKRKMEETELEIPTKSGSLYIPDFRGGESIPSSKSVESDLSGKLKERPANWEQNDDEIEVEPLALKPPLCRSRSKSEPDTALLAGPTDIIERQREREESKEIRVVDSEDSKMGSIIPPISDDLLSPDTFEKLRNDSDDASSTATRETRSFPVKTDVSLEQTYGFGLEEKCRYINITLWSRRAKNTPPFLNPKDGSPIDPDPLLVGYTSIFVPEVLEDCGMTLSNYHEQSYPLRPPHKTTVLQKYEKLLLHPGFDSRLCYGDITVGTRWYPQGLSPSLLDQDSLDPEILGPVTIGDQTSSRKGHSWLNTHFQQAVSCSLCQKKIWLKTASQCGFCLMICHKKCQPKADEILTCGGRGPAPKLLSETSDSFDSVASSALGTVNSATAGASDIIDLHEAEGAAEAVTVSMMEEPVILRAASSVRRGKKLQLALTEKISSLRRRRPHSEIIQGSASIIKNSTALSYKGLISEEQRVKLKATGIQESALAGLGDSFDPNSQFHTLLYTKGGTYNEHVIHAAKDLGRGLFADLEPEERKKKINEQINILQKEIDATAQERLEIMQNAKTPAEGSEKRRDSPNELTKVDDKLQALAVLMLHYCAGLQHCLDMEEQECDPEAFPSLDETNLKELTAECGSEKKSEDDLSSPEQNERNSEMVDDKNSGQSLRTELEEIEYKEEQQEKSEQHNKKLLDYLVSSQKS